MLINPYVFGGSFVPTDIAGCEVWLDASDADTLYDSTSGGNLVAPDGSVARWEDKSGNSYNLTQSGAKPIRKTAVQNSLDVLRFDGSSQYMFGTCVSLKHFIAVIKYDLATFASYSGGVTGANDATDTFIFVGSSGSTSMIAGSTIKHFNGVSSSAGPMQAFAVMSCSLSAGFCTTSLRVGKYPDSFANQFWDGDIAEVIGYDTVLSSTDRGTVEQYLADKWGISI